MKWRLCNRVDGRQLQGVEEGEQDLNYLRAVRRVSLYYETYC